MAQNTVIATLAAMVKQSAPIMFNNPDAAPYTAYQVGDALGFIAEGWTLKEVKGDWVNLVCEDQPDRAIHTDSAATCHRLKVERPNNLSKWSNWSTSQQP
jgi:hypothetical protein